MVKPLIFNYKSVLSSFINKNRFSLEPNSLSAKSYSPRCYVVHKNVSSRFHHCPPRFIWKRLCFNDNISFIKKFKNHHYELFSQKIFSLRGHNFFPQLILSPVWQQRIRIIAFSICLHFFFILCSHKNEALRGSHSKGKSS